MFSELGYPFVKRELLGIDVFCGDFGLEYERAVRNALRNLQRDFSNGIEGVIVVASDFKVMGEIAHKFHQHLDKDLWEKVGLTTIQTLRMLCNKNERKNMIPPDTCVGRNTGGHLDQGKQVQLINLASGAREHVRVLPGETPRDIKRATGIVTTAVLIKDGEAEPFAQDDDLYPLITEQDIVYAVTPTCVY
jgi:hypothetical protein